jgi:hypothetical protein
MFSLVVGRFSQIESAWRRRHSAQAPEFNLTLDNGWHVADQHLRFPQTCSEP